MHAFKCIDVGIVKATVDAHASTSALIFGNLAPIRDRWLLMHLVLIVLRRNHIIENLIQHI
jgi:hypothetical protein